MPRRHSTRLETPDDLLVRLEELVLANAGTDPFEAIFQLLLAKLADERSGDERRFCTGPSHGETARAVSALVREAAGAWPELITEPDLLLEPAHLHVCVDAMAPFELDLTELSVLDALLERIAARGERGAKGQFFTPRNVVRLCVELIDPRPGERIADPACGSGGFLLGALAHVRRLGGEPGALLGVDFDPRAARLARALLLFAAERRGDITIANSLAREALDPGSVDVLLTNPPFAGEVRQPDLLESYGVASLARAERDSLFLERCLELLAPGGRMAIVLPQNKFGARPFAGLRAWLLERAQVLGAVGLPRETFLPHTHQKTAILLVRNVPPRDEPLFFAVSERCGKDRRGRALGSDDFATIVDAWAGDRPDAVRPSELSDGCVLAPERYDPRRRPEHLAAVPHRRLGELVQEIRDTVTRKSRDIQDVLAADTSHARDGVLRSDLPIVATSELGSARKRVRAGDVIVSRLRPYLRQIAVVDHDHDGRLVVSPEFYVLRSHDGTPVSWLVPYLLSAAVQAALAAAQEGGHHPRVPLETLLALPVPERLIAQHATLSATVDEALALRRRADEALRRSLESATDLLG